MAFMFSLLTRGPLLLLPLLRPCPYSHLLRLTLTACEADPPGAARFINRNQNREDPILQARLDMVGIDRPGEGDRPFKRAGGDFPQEPVVSLAMAIRSALL